MILFIYLLIMLYDTLLISLDIFYNFIKKSAKIINIFLNNKYLLTKILFFKLWFTINLSAILFSLLLLIIYCITYTYIIFTHNINAGFSMVLINYPSIGKGIWMVWLIEPSPQAEFWMVWIFRPSPQGGF